MTKQQWRDLGRGTGKRPDGVGDDDVVRWRYAGGDVWSDVKEAGFCFWTSNCEYQLLVRTPAEPDVLREALRNIQIEAEREKGSWVHLKRVIAVNARTALAATKPTTKEE